MFPGAEKSHMARTLGYSSVRPAKRTVSWGSGMWSQGAWLGVNCVIWLTNLRSSRLSSSGVTCCTLLSSKPLSPLVSKTRVSDTHQGELWIPNARGAQYVFHRWGMDSSISWIATSANSLENHRVHVLLVSSTGRLLLWHLVILTTIPSILCAFIRGRCAPCYKYKTVHVLALAAFITNH